MVRVVHFEDLANADLVVDAIYEGGTNGNVSDDPIGKLLPGSGNQGGFRAAGRGSTKDFVVLYTTGEDNDWPDSLDVHTGQFVYFGDNKTPGHELHETTRGGNNILRDVFSELHLRESNRNSIPPFLVFKKYPTDKSKRSVQFKGLAAPGFHGLTSNMDLVAVWKSTGEQRFQNYQATFTILDVPIVDKGWLVSRTSQADSFNLAPSAWKSFVSTGKYRALAASKTASVRKPDQQLPQGAAKVEILLAVWDHFREAPLKFEDFAARIYQMTDSRILIDEFTRGSMDGGRDAIGRYLIGLKDDPVFAEFALEAKCYRPGIGGMKPNTVGVKEIARLVSRIKHRQFGVLVTTSLVARQAYEEVRDDRHPLVFICGKDIVDILQSSGYSTLASVKKLLVTEYSIT